MSVVIDYKEKQINDGVKMGRDEQVLELLKQAYNKDNNDIAINPLRVNALLFELVIGDTSASNISEITTSIAYRMQDLDKENGTRTLKDAIKFFELTDKERVEIIKDSGLDVTKFEAPPLAGMTTRVAKIMKGVLKGEIDRIKKVNPDESDLVLPEDFTAPKISEKPELLLRLTDGNYAPNDVVKIARAVSKDMEIPAIDKSIKFLKSYRYDDIKIINLMEQESSEIMAFKAMKDIIKATIIATLEQVKAEKIKNLPKNSTQAVLPEPIKSKQLGQG